MAAERPTRTYLNPAFPNLLADNAARVAERYPWIKSFTP